MNEISNNKKIVQTNNTINNIPEIKSIDDILTDLKNTMINRCQNEVTDYSDFANVKETIKNTDKNHYAGEMSLICEPAEKNSAMRYLSFYQLNPQNKKGLSCMIATGSKDEILKKLKDENFLQILKENSLRISQKMKDLRW